MHSKNVKIKSIKIPVAIFALPSVVVVVVTAIVVDAAVVVVFVVGLSFLGGGNS